LLTGNIINLRRSEQNKNVTQSVKKE
jgi:hypothetical protein